MTVQLPETFLRISIILLLAAGILQAEQTTIPNASDCPVFLILGQAPGLSVDETEAAVTRPLEHRLAQSQGVRRIESRTTAGLSVIRGRLHGDICGDQVLSIMNAAIRGANEPLLADLCRPLTVMLDLPSAQLVGYVTIEEPKIQDEVATVLFEQTLDQVLLALNGIPSIRQLGMLGGKNRVMVVRLDRQKLAARRLTACDVMSALKQRLAAPAVGVFRTGSIAYHVSLPPPTAADVSALPLATKGPAGCILADVALVQQSSFAAGGTVRVDGEQTIAIPVYANRPQDAKHTRDDVSQVVEKLNATGSAGRVAYLPLAVDQDDSDDGLITIRLRLPSGTRLAVTDKQCDAIAAIVREQLADEVAFCITEVGVPDSCLAAMSSNAAECDAVLRVQLLPKRKTPTAETAARLVTAFDQERNANRINALTQITTSASELIELRAAGRSSDARRPLEQLLHALQGRFPQAWILERLDAPGFQISLDDRKAADVGVTAEQVALTIAALTGGPAASLFEPRTGRRWQLASGAESLSLEDLQNATVPVAANGTFVPLGNLVQIRRTMAPLEIDHIDLEPIFRAQFVVDRAEREAAVAQIRRAADKLRAPGAPQIEVVGADSYGDH